MGIEDGEQTYDGTMEGVEAAARQLTADREVRDAAVAREAEERPQPRQLSADEIEQARWARDTFRNTVAAQVQADSEAEGGKFNSRKAGQALALLREHEAATAQQTEADEQADAYAQQAAAQAAESQSVENHPHVVATLQRLSQHETAMEGARQQYEYLTNEMFKSAFSNAMQEFADIQSNADVEYLAASNPERYGRFQHVYQTLRSARDHIAQTVAQQGARQQAQFNAYAAQHDEAFNARHPELRSPAALMAAAKDSVEALKAVGLSEGEIGHAWRTNPLLRDHRVQTLLYEMGRMHVARASVRDSRRAPVPQVQRPGVARDRHVDYSEVQQLKAKLGDAPLSVKDAGALLAAQRRARAR